MAAVLGDLLQITDFQTLLSQQVLNVYYFRVVSLTGFTDDGYPSILDWYEDTILPAVVAVQGTGLVHTRLLIQNLSNGLDFVDRPLSPTVAGTRVGNMMPPFVAWSFRLVRESLATRNGAKRYGGVVEEDVSAGVATADVSDELAALAAVLDNDIVVGLATLAEPVIVRRPLEVPVGTSYTYASIGSADYRQVGSQNTRKLGRGI